MIVQPGVADLVKQISPRGICDDCIAKELDWAYNQCSSDQTVALSKLPDFHRENELCYVCGAAKYAVRYDPDWDLEDDDPSGQSDEDGINTGTNRVFLHGRNFDGAGCPITDPVGSDLEG